MKKEFKDARKIPGFPGYFAFSDGRILSYKKNKFPHPHPHFLTVCRHRFGYGVVVLYKNKKRRTLNVHRLVLMAFRGKCPKGMQGAHLDGNPRNNNLENLAWVTIAENHFHKRKHGTHLVGRKLAWTKRTESEVRRIRKLHATGKFTYNALAKMFRCSSHGISSITKRETWKHIK